MLPSGVLTVEDDPAFCAQYPDAKIPAGVLVVADDATFPESDDELGERWAREIRKESAAAAPKHDNSWLWDNPDTLALPYTWAAKFPAAKAPREIVEKIFEAGTLACTYGDSNTGKSTLILDVCLAIATPGARWRGRRTADGIVFWLSLESAAGTRRRVAAWCRKHGRTPDGLLFADVTTAVRLLELQDAQSLIAAIRAAEAEAGQKCVLVVIDTLARAMAGGDENTSKDMGQLVLSCDEIRRETGATVLLIHHSGKDSSKGARGSGSLRAAIDTEIEVSGQANPRQMKVTKQRDLPSGDTFAFDLEAVEIGEDEETGETFTAVAVVHRDDVPTGTAEPKGHAVATILRALRAQQAERHRAGKVGPVIWTIEDMRTIGRTLGQHRNTARDAVDRLATSGLLTPTVGGHRLTEVSQ